MVTVRRPEATVSSIKYLKWRIDVANLLEQPLLMRDYLEPFRADLERFAGKPDDVIASASMMWKAAYAAVDKYRRIAPNIIVLRHEDLSLNPVEEFRAPLRTVRTQLHPRRDERNRQLDRRP